MVRRGGRLVEAVLYADGRPIPKRHVAGEEDGVPYHYGAEAEDSHWGRRLLLVLAAVDHDLADFERCLRVRRLAGEIRH